MDTNIHKFANIVTVCAKPVDEDASTFQVYWQSGVHRQGKVIVTIPIDIKDKIAVAELTAMQFLIEEKEIIGRVPPLKGLKLIFGVPHIQKIRDGSSAKQHLYPYAYYLKTRFSDVILAIDKTTDWIKPRAENHVTELEVLEPPGEWLDVHNVGRISITVHAMEQFRIRMNNATGAEAWKALTGILSSWAIKPYQPGGLSDERAEQAGAYRILDSDSNWCFVIGTNKHGHPSILTAYIEGLGRTKTR